MPLTPEELQMRRTPSELLALVEKVHQLVRTCRSEFEAGITKKGLYKEFLDEVQPLCAFAAARYPQNFMVQPILGNQGFDAIVFDAQGQETERLEFARPYDGAAGAKAARQVVSRGHSDAEIRDYTDPLGSLIPFIRTTAKAKSLKDYRGITLVFVLAAPPPITSTESSFADQVAQITQLISENTFSATKVLLFLPPHQIIDIHQPPKVASPD